MGLKNILLVAQKESREALTNRWFIIYAVSFAALALLLLLIGSSRSELAEYSGFGRTAASLINLIMLFVPLIALTTGSIAISNERENGTLTYLLSHPITKSEVLLGKYLGILVTIWLTLLFGFGLGGVVIASRGILYGADLYLIIIFLSALLASSFLSVGFMVTVLTSKTSKSLGIAVFLWLFFLVFGDLGLMGSAVIMNIGADTLFWITSVNPVEAFKIASVLSLSPRFEILGPAGVYAMRNFGETTIFILLSSILLLWSVLPLMLSIFYFSFFRKEEK